MSGGLYKNIKMSVKSANVIVLSLIAVFIATFAILVCNNGFTVSFDTVGGTEVQSIRLMHGDKVSAQTPKKEGFRFTGWYLDKGCTVMWDTNNDTVTDSMTLYAGWQKEEADS